MAATTPLNPVMKILGWITILVVGLVIGRTDCAVQGPSYTTTFGGLLTTPITVETYVSDTASLTDDTWTSVSCPPHLGLVSCLPTTDAGGNTVFDQSTDLADGWQFPSEEQCTVSAGSSNTPAWARAGCVDWEGAGYPPLGNASYPMAEFEDSNGPAVCPGGSRLIECRCMSYYQSCPEFEVAFNPFDPLDGTVYDNTCESGRVSAPMCLPATACSTNLTLINSCGAHERCVPDWTLPYSQGRCECAPGFSRGVGGDCQPQEWEITPGCTVIRPMDTWDWSGDSAFVFTAADVDGDGYDDAVGVSRNTATDFAAALIILMQVEPGVFVYDPERTANVDAATSHLAVAYDVDSDGHLDIVTAAWNLGMNWYRNQERQGTWGYFDMSARTFIKYSGIPRDGSIQLGDLDHDNFTELYVNSRFHAQIYRIEATTTNGTTWGPTEVVAWTNRTSAIGPSDGWIGPDRLAPADIDGDGTMDFVVFQLAGLGWYMADGTYYKLPGTCHDGTVADFVGNDGYPDVLCLTGEVFINRMGQGADVSNAWESAPEYATEYGHSFRTIFFSDVDADGDLDIVASMLLRNTPIYACKNLGGGLFDSCTLLSYNYKDPRTAYFWAGELFTSPTVSTALFTYEGVRAQLSWNNDGSSHVFSALHTIGSKNWRDEVEFGYAAILSVDLDGDNLQDVVLSVPDSPGVEVLRNTGRSRFGHKISVDTNLPPSWYACGFDADGDGDTDVAVATDDGIYVLHNTQPPPTYKVHLVATLVIPRSAPLAKVLSAVVAGDANGDGVADDLFFSGLDGREVAVAVNNGNGTSFTVTTLTSGSRVAGVAVADLNGDGRDDMVATMIDLDLVRVWLWTESGYVSAANVSCESPSWPVLSPVVGTGSYDLLVSSWRIAGGDNVQMWTGVGNGSFTDQQVLTSHLFPGRLGVFNVVTRTGGSRAVVYADAGSEDGRLWKQEWDGTSWGLPQPMGSNLGKGILFVDIVDFDGNGAADLVWATYGTAPVTGWMLMPDSCPSEAAPPPPPFPPPPPSPPPSPPPPPTSSPSSVVSSAAASSEDEGLFGNTVLMAGVGGGVLVLSLVVVGGVVWRRVRRGGKRSAKVGVSDGGGTEMKGAWSSGGSGGGGDGAESGSDW